MYIFFFPQALTSSLTSIHILIFHLFFLHLPFASSFTLFFIIMFPNPFPISSIFFFVLLLPFFLTHFAVIHYILSFYPILPPLLSSVLILPPIILFSSSAFLIISSFHLLYFFPFTVHSFFLPLPLPLSASSFLTFSLFSFFHILLLTPTLHTL